MSLLQTKIANLLLATKIPQMTERGNIVSLLLTKFANRIVATETSQLTERGKVPITLLPVAIIGRLTVTKKLLITSEITAKCT